MGLKKPSDYFKRESNNIKNMVGNPNLNSYSESFNTFKENLSKFEKITETIEVVNQLKEELQNFLKKEDLDNAMLSYVFLLEESIENLQSNVKSINSKTLAEIKSKVSNVTDVVNEFIEVDIPKYKKNIVDVEVKTDQKFIEFKEEFDNVISQLSDDIDKKQFEISNNSENNLNEAVSNLENHIKDIDDSNKSISNTLKVKVNEIQKLKKKVVEELKVNKTINESLKEKVENLQIELIRGENNLKEQNINFQKIENGFKDTIEKLNVPELEKENFVLSTKIKHLEEVYEKLKEESKINETLIEQTLPSTETSDPLTPLDQNYVTLDQLQQHYRLFLGRIQTQLSTLGGGGETRLQYLDDIVGIATNLSEYDGKFLKVDTSQPAGKNFVFETVSGGGGSVVGISTTGSSFFNQLNVSGVSTFSNDINVTGISSFKNIINSGVTSVGIVTALPGGLAPVYFGDGSNLQNINASNVNNGELPAGVLPGSVPNLNVTGIGTITTLSATTVSIAGTLTYEDVTNIDSVGLITAREGIRIGAGKSIGSDGAAVVYYGDGSNLTGVGGFTADGNQNLFPSNTCSGCNLTTGVSNLLIGSCAGKSVTDGGCNILFGYNAGKSLSGGTVNTYIGRDAGCCATDGSWDIGIGNGVLKNSKRSCANIAIGYNVLENQNTHYPSGVLGLGNIGLGYGVGTAHTNGKYNIFVGYLNATSMTSGDCNIFLGHRAGKDATGSTSNIFIGCYAGRSSGSGGCAGQGNIALGNLSGICLGSTSDRNVFVGESAGRTSTGGSFNVALGADSGYNVTGSRNTFLGFYAGANATSGCCNIAIGNLVCLPFATGSSQLAIGSGHTSWIIGNSDYNVGIGTTIPRFTLEVGAVGASGTSLHVNGDARITGILTIGTSSITLDPSEKKISGLDEIQIGTGSTAIKIKKSATGDIEFVDESGQEKSVGIGTTVSINTSGIITASAFHGDGSALTNLPAGTPDKIEEGDSKIEVTDSGTGQINLVVDGNHFARFTNVSGRKAIFGSNVSVQNNYGSNCGDIIIANGGRRFRLFRTGVGLADDSIIGTIDFAAQQSGTGGQSVSLIESSLRGGVENKSDLIFSTSNGGSPTEKVRIMHTGNVGIGTTNPDAAVGAGNTAKLSVGILSAYQLYGDGSNLTGISGGGGGFSQDDQGNLVAGTNAGAAKDADTCFNIMIGCNAGVALCGGYGHSILMGCHTGKSITTGAYNFLFGKRSGCLMTTASYNITLGNGNGTTMTTGCHNIFFGNGIASGGGGTGEHCNNIIMGQESGYNLNTGDDNIAIGKQAGCDISTGNRNIYLGKLTGTNSTTGSGNIALGCGAMMTGTVTGDDNIAIGEGAGTNLTSGNNNIALGGGSLECCMTAGLCNIAIGKFAGRKIQNDCNIAIGSCALFGSGGGVGYCNIAIGLNAGRKLTNGHDNIFMGTCAGMHITGSGSADGSYNIGFGREALGGLADGGSTTGNFNAVMGFYSGRKISSGSNNVLMGRNTGCSITSGGANVFLGLGAGKCVSTGNRNIAIGVNVTPPSDTGSCQLVIGVESSYWMVGNSDFNVGIGTTNPNAPVGVGNTAKLSVGIVSAYQLYGNGSGLTGITATGITTISGQLNLNGMSKETINIVANKLSAATDIDLEDGLVHYFSTTETADATPNIRFNSSTTLNSKLSVGDSITVTIISSTNNTSYSYEQLTIDGSAVTEQWIGGAPPSGGSSGYDIYTFQIIKTADATYLVFGNKVNFT